MGSASVVEGQMRALRTNPGAPSPQVEFVDIPSVGPQDVLIQVASVGLAPGVFTLCKQGRLAQLPTTLDHEVAGVIEKVGDAVTTVRVGQRVRLRPNITCGRCYFCTTDRDQMCSEAAIIGFASFGRGPTPLFDRYHEGGGADFLRAPMRSSTLWRVAQICIRYCLRSPSTARWSTWVQINPYYLCLWSLPWSMVGVLLVLRITLAAMHKTSCAGFAMAA